MKVKWKKTRPCLECGKECFKLYRGEDSKKGEKGKRCWTCHIIHMEKN